MDFSSIISGGLTVGAGLLGSLITNKQNSALAYQNNMANYMMGLQNHAWAQQMRATQYQTAVKDMKKAGLNPAMMYGGGGAGGAGVPNVGSPPMQAAHVEDAVGPAVSKALDALRVSNETELNKAVVAKNVQDSATSAASAENIQADTANKKLSFFTILPEAAARIAASTGSAKAAEGAAAVSAASLPGVEANSGMSQEKLSDYRKFGTDPLNLGAGRRAAITALDFAQGLQVPTSAKALESLPSIAGKVVGLRHAAGLTPKYTNRAN